jgi:hypothetical protein
LHHQAMAIVLFSPLTQESLSRYVSRYESGLGHYPELGRRTMPASVAWVSLPGGTKLRTTLSIFLAAVPSCIFDQVAGSPTHHTIGVFIGGGERGICREGGVGVHHAVAQRRAPSRPQQEAAEDHRRAHMEGQNREQAPASCSRRFAVVALSPGSCISSVLGRAPEGSHQVCDAADS